MGEGRINHIKRILREDKVDGILITNLENIRYLSGFTGSDAALVITK
ncbi:MAG: aminopeptidase P family N-terminal domain-containing protein, partial [Deltaproteobacteria bacterium]|nr:aminopeptidase P family N-terminal domain-containing protein [Deltaproteobacteria bacterium]